VASDCEAIGSERKGLQVLSFMSGMEISVQSKNFL
jgi:hypothetical protein